MQEMRISSAHRLSAGRTILLLCLFVFLKEMLRAMQIPALMGMLQSGERGQQGAAVAALASLADGNALVSAAIAAVSGSVAALQGLLRDRDPGIRLLAAACLVQLLRYEHVATSNQVGFWQLLATSAASSMGTNRFASAGSK